MLRVVGDDDQPVTLVHAGADRPSAHRLARDEARAAAAPRRADSDYDGLVVAGRTASASVKSASAATTARPPRERVLSEIAQASVAALAADAARPVTARV